VSLVRYPYIPNKEGQSIYRRSRSIVNGVFDYHYEV